MFYRLFIKRPTGYLSNYKLCTMKKIILFLALIVSLSACTLDNDNNDYYTYQVLPITSYVLPETFTLGQTYTITLKYQRPTACDLFQGIYYSKDLNTRTIAIQTATKNNQACTQELPELSETKFDFKVTNTGSYIFKFFKGKDIEGKDTFEDVEIQVVDKN